MYKLLLIISINNIIIIVEIILNLLLQKIKKRFSRIQKIIIIIMNI